MPIYEYGCKKCGNKFELIRRLPKRDDPAPCPKCNARITKRIEMQRVAVPRGTRPNAAMGEGEPEDFIDGGDDFGMDDFDFDDDF